MAALDTSLSAVDAEDEEPVATLTLSLADSADSSSNSPSSAERSAPRERAADEGGREARG